MRHRLVTAAAAAVLLATAAGVAVAIDPVDQDLGGIPIPDGIDDGIPLPEPELPAGPVFDGPPANVIGGDEPPAGAQLVPAPRPNGSDVASLLTYLNQQQMDLHAVTSAEPMLAAVTLRQAMPVAEFEQLLEVTNVEPAYVEWQLADGPDHGGTAWELWPQMEKQRPNAKITYFSTTAPAAKLQALAEAPEVWLVDIGTGPLNAAGSTPLVQALPKNYYYDALQLGILSR
jgi:hypothetical protein